MKIFAKILLGIAIVVVALGIYWGYSFFTFLNSFGGPEQLEFQQNIWITHDNLDETENPRGTMIADLINNHLKKGLHRNEVIKLLGKPFDEKIRKRLVNGEADSLRNKVDEQTIESLNQLYTEYGDPDTLMLYPIGWCSGFGIDPDFLAIKINRDSLTVDFWAEQH